MPFTPKQGIELNHWVKGSKELIEQQEFEEDGTPKPYFSKNITFSWKSLNLSTKTLMIFI